MKSMNIFLTGVGGQGIGLLSEILIRATDHAGYMTKGTDTHGLAQRGGIVISQIKIGSEIFSPLIQEGMADLVIALERTEALRGAKQMLKEGGTLLYYNTVWLPLPVRLRTADEITEKDVSDICGKLNAKEIRLDVEDLPDPIHQNIVILANIAGRKLIPEIKLDDYKEAMDDLMEGEMLRTNMKLFDKEVKSA